MCAEQQSVASPRDGENREDSLLLPVASKVSQESPFPGLHCGFAHLVSVSKVNSPYKLTNLEWELPPCSGSEIVCWIPVGEWFSFIQLMVLLE